MNNSLMTSGIGQYHTNEPAPTKPDKKLTPYLTIDWLGIRTLVDKPQEVDKTQARWVIPSTHASRNFKDQEKHGEYWMLWADLDKNPPALVCLYGMVEGFLEGADYELYNSRSATLENQKARLLIPLDTPLCYADWNLAQETLNDNLEALGIITDRASERGGQLCYLPNRSPDGLYSQQSRRDDVSFNPLQSWAQEIAAKREKIESDRLALEAAKQASMAKRAALSLSDAYDLIGAFNLVYTPQEWMIKAGYSQRGDSFRHPLSESGSYSATVRADEYSVLRANTLSTSDPLFNKGAGAHDAFSIFCTLFHGGDRSAALKDAGDNLLTIGLVSYNKAQQIEWRKQQEQTKNDQDNADVDEEPFDFSQFSINGDIDVMRKLALDQVYILDELALLGQVTVIYAKPNTGKTLLLLWLLIDAVLKRRIGGNCIHYVNADDDYNGMLDKAELLRKHGINTVSPGYHGFEVKHLTVYLNSMVKDGTAKNQIIALDTLKKFTELMDKKISSDFMKAVRQFIGHGGSMILLAHTNKNRTLEGKAVAGGTSDIIDDADCAYILDEICDDGSVKQVLFENIKMRGNVAKTVAYSYISTSKISWINRFDSIKRIDDDLLDAAKKQRDINAQLEKDSEIIQCIVEVICVSPMLKTNLVDHVRKELGISRARVIKVLNEYTGTNKAAGHLWRSVRSEKGASVTFYLLSMDKPATATEYREAKNGQYR